MTPSIGFACLTNGSPAVIVVGSRAPLVDKNAGRRRIRISVLAYASPSPHVQISHGKADSDDREGRQMTELRQKRRDVLRVEPAETPKNQPEHT